MIPRRQFLLRSGTLFCAGAVWTGGVVQAQAMTRASIAVPGPGNLLFLPITLARKIGADRAEGMELDIR